MIIVITGKTASGKDTIIKSILTKFPNLKKIITTTSRNPRENETDGIDYHFVSKEQFNENIANQEFLEYVEYGGNMYGTEKKEFNGQEILWKIDPSRAGKVRELISDLLLVVYINAPSDIILQRLKKRGLSEIEIEKRMADDKRIWEKYKNSYDYVVDNVYGQLDETIDKITKIIKA